MKELDVLKLKISNIENSEVYVAKSKSYKWINHLDSMAPDGSLFDTRKD
jgi:hypothetical protein